MQTYVVKFKSFKSVIRLQPLEKIPKVNKGRAMFIPDSRVKSFGKFPTNQNKPRN